MGPEASCSSVWWRRGILGQPFPKWTKWPFVCCSGPWLTGLQHAIMLCFCLSLGLSTPKGSGGEDCRGKEGVGWRVDWNWKTEGKQEERGKEKRCSLNPGCLPSHPPFPLLRLPHFHPAPPWLPLCTQWLLLCWNFTLLDPGPGVLSSHNVQAAEHAAGETHFAS